MNNNPIFILGNPRSGTTLLRVILNANDEILIPPECGFMIWLYDKFKNNNFKNEDELRSFLSELQSIRKFGTWEINMPELEIFLKERILIGSYQELADLIYRFYGLSKNIQFKRWGDKNNFYINHIDEILKIFPESQFVHLIRDGRDVACSYMDLKKKNINSKYKPNLTTDIHEIAIEWQNNNKRITDNLKQVDLKNKIVIKYEDLILNFENTVDKLVSFLNVRMDQKMYNYHKIDSFEPNEFLQWKEKINQKPDASGIGRYKNYLSIDQIELFDSTAKETLNRYEYLN